MKRDAKVMSHWPGNKKSPGHSQGLSDIFRDSDRHSWNSSELDCPLDQPDGLMTDWSSRSQKSNIRVFHFADGAGNIGSDCLFEALWVHVIADETKEILG